MRVKGGTVVRCVRYRWVDSPALAPELGVSTRDHNTQSGGLTRGAKQPSVQCMVHRAGMRVCARIWAAHWRAPFVYLWRGHVSTSNCILTCDAGNWTRSFAWKMICSNRITPVIHGIKLGSCCFLFSSGSQAYDALQSRVAAESRLLCWYLCTNP